MKIEEIKEKIESGETILYGVKIDEEAVPKISVIKKDKYTTIELKEEIENHKIVFTELTVHNSKPKMLSLNWYNQHSMEWNFNEIFSTIQEALDYILAQTTEINEIKHDKEQTKKLRNKK